jgi:ParB-like chromosome segregation protein Spo0J
MSQTIESVPIDQLEPHPANPRQGDVGLIHQLIEENGWYGSILVQRATGYILVGNHRYKAAKALGFSTLPVEWRDCDDEAALRILLGDNGSSDAAAYDEPLLASLLQHLTHTPSGLTGTGKTGDDLDDLLRQINQPITTPTTCGCCGRPLDG